MAIVDGVDTETGQIVDWAAFNFAQNRERAHQENVARQQQQQAQPSGDSGQPAPTPTPTPTAAPAGGDISLTLETLKLGYAQQASQQAYLNERQRLIDVPMLDLQRDQLALQRAEQTALEAYRAKDLELRQLQLTQSTQQFQQTLVEQQRQFNAQQQVLQAQLAEQQRQFDLTAGERRRQFDVAQAEQQRQFNEQQRLQQAGLTGFLGGTPTLAREQFTAQQQAEAYQRAANPARAFENELARGATGVPSLAANLVQPPAAGQPAAQLANAGQAPVRVPAVVNAFRQGAGIPTAGQFGVASTVAPASQAALTEADFRLANQKTLGRLNPNQALILGSFGRAGGVTNELQDFYRTRGRPPATETTGSYALR